MAQELQISLRLCTLSAEAYQGIVGDPVWQEAWCRIVSRSCIALCGCVPCPQVLTKAL